MMAVRGARPRGLERLGRLEDEIGPFERRLAHRAARAGHQDQHTDDRFGEATLLDLRERGLAPSGNSRNVSPSLASVSAVYPSFIRIRNGLA